MNKIGLLLCCLLAFIFLSSCGDSRYYTSPVVYKSNIVQSECKQTGGVSEVLYEVDGDEIIVTHTNILLPEGSLLGLENEYGVSSIDSDYNYYSLPGDDRNINIVEVLSASGSGDSCYYDLKLTIKDVSGGEYCLLIWDYNGKLFKKWDDVWVD